jgi:S1-C subfamily serine protease
MQALSDISAELERLVASAGRSAIEVEGRRGPPAPATAWSADGVALAAQHLVDDDGLEARLPGGERVPAEVVGRDAPSDLAVLRLRATGLTPAPFGAPPLAAGALVVGVARTARGVRADLGLVSRTSGEWRAPSGAALERLVELSLPLRPGFSGTLVLSAGGVPLGIATAGLRRGRATLLPAEALARLVPALLEHGAVPRGYLGLATLPARLPAAAGRGTGLLVTAVEPGSPAERAGLLLGDALLDAGDAPLADPRDLLPLVDPRRVGERVRLRAWRAGAPLQLELTVGARPAPEGR